MKAYIITIQQLGSIEEAIKEKLSMLHFLDKQKEFEYHEELLKLVLNIKEAMLEMELDQIPIFIN